MSPFTWALKTMIKVSDTSLKRRMPVELARQVLVGGDVVGEEGEAVERGVAPGVEDQYRGALDDVEDDVSQSVGTEDVEDLLAHDGRGADGVGQRVRPRRDERRSEQKEGEDARHPDEGLARVGRFGTTKTRHSVRDR